MIIGLMLFALSSCEKDENQGGQAAYEFKMMAKSTKSMGSWSINSATAILTELELELEDAISDEEFDLEGRHEINLLTGNSSPALPEIDKSAGLYEELEITLGEDDDNETALLIEAEWTQDSTTTLVNIEVTGELEYELESENGIVIEDEMSKELTVFVGIENALQALSLSQAQVGPNNTVFINKGTNTGLYADFVAALNFELDD